MKITFLSVHHTHTQIHIQKPAKENIIDALELQANKPHEFHLFENCGRSRNVSNILKFGIINLIPTPNTHQSAFYVKSFHGSFTQNKQNQKMAFGKEHHKPSQSPP